MTHFLKKLVAAWFILGSGAVGFAQQMPPIPTDAYVRIGKLENGLTYYIRFFFLFVFCVVFFLCFFVVFVLFFVCLWFC